MMVIVDNILVSEDVLQKRFVCSLKSCKGACCWEGDWGAPLEKEELETLQLIQNQVRPYLADENISQLDHLGPYVFYPELDNFGTPLLANGACVYLAMEENGIGYCAIEKAYLDQKIDFVKPVSCHLYPIRVLEKEELAFVALNYDSWEICHPACMLGQSLNTPLYKFVKKGLVRKFGIQFYQKLEEIAENNHIK